MKICFVNWMVAIQFLKLCVHITQVFAMMLSDSLSLFLGSNFKKECSSRRLPLMARLSAANNLQFHCHPKVTDLRVTPYQKVTFQFRLIHAKITEYIANRCFKYGICSKG